MASPVILSGSDGRDETAAERLDRNTIELLNELRVAGTGIQIMFAFLLIVPFNAGWPHVSSFGRTVYIVTLLCVAVSSVLLIAPSVHHRILFRHGQKEYLIRTANRLAILAAAFLAAGFTGILVLIADVVTSGVGTVVIGVVAAVGITAIWFGLPLVHLLGHRGDEPETAGAEKH